jgi:hypothetical protein
MSYTPGLDAYYDQMLDDWLEDYFTDRENQWEGIYDEEENDDEN